jgi:hypothetical protein
LDNPLEWLVEIRVSKGSVHFILGDSIVTYEEVLAKDEQDAKSKAYRQFVTRCTYEPVLRRRVSKRGLKVQSDYHAGEAIKID